MEVPTLDLLIAIQHLATAQMNLKESYILLGKKMDKYSNDRDAFIDKYKCFLPLDIVNHDNGTSTINPGYQIIDGKRVIVSGYVFKGNNCVGHADSPGAKGEQGFSGYSKQNTMSNKIDNQ